MTAIGRLRRVLGGLESRGADLAIATLAGVAGVLGSYAVAGFTPEFVAAPVAALLATNLPGSLITFAILVLGDLGQQLNLLTAIAIAVAGFAAASGAGMAIGRRPGRPSSGVLAGVFCTLLAYVVAGAVVAALGAGAGSALVVAAGEWRFGRRRTEAPSPTGSRRHVLGSLAGLLGVGAVAAVARRTVSRSDDSGGPASLDGEPRDDGAFDGTGPLLQEANEKSLDVDGLEPLVSDQFYTVDIATVDPAVPVDDWTLSITGAVDEEMTLDYDDVRSYPTEHRFVTLRCVGESLNGKKMDNALWTGVPIASLLDRIAPRSGCECVKLRAADDYFQVFPLAALQRGFLAFGMNGTALPRAHGRPVRTLIPGHWGEINVKWLTGIEFLDRRADGYWEKRGWHGTGPVNTVAKLHVTNRLGDGRVQVAGHAYAGIRGVSAVQVSADGGDTWEDAALSEPLPGEDVWRQWAHTLEVDGETEVTVRAIETDGTVQSAERADPFPSGPSGWVTKTVRP